MSTRRVVITGMGAVTALGLDVAQFCDALRMGRSGIRPFETIDSTSLRFKNGAEVSGFTPTDHFNEKELDQIDRFAQLGIVAARESVRDAVVEGPSELRESTAVVTGASLGGKTYEEQAYAGLFGEQTRRPHPLTVPRGMANAAASHISMEFGLHGRVYHISTACASSTHALGQAFWLVRSGAAELALAGGCESPFVPGHLRMWEGLRVISPDTCRPFSKDGRGMILGEGGAMLVLETLDAALARSARVYAEIVGVGGVGRGHPATHHSAP